MPCYHNYQLLIGLQATIQETPPTSIDLPVTDAIPESSVVSPQNSSLLISSRRKSDIEGLVMPFYDSYIIVCMLCNCRD